jgi:hypothetical protein
MRQLLEERRIDNVYARRSILGADVIYERNGIRFVWDRGHPVDLGPPGHPWRKRIV